MSAIKRLLEIASDPILFDYSFVLGNNDFSNKTKLLDSINQEIFSSLDNLLKLKNGFVAFESALYLLPTHDSLASKGLISWNDKNGWKSFYQFDNQLLFFAQDVFASQYAISKDNIIKLNPESGEVEFHSTSLEMWADKILADYSYETGWEIASEWQKVYGISLGSKYRLLPKKPFIIGGDYVIDNLVAVDSFTAAMKLGKLYSQIKGIPDGEKIVIKDWL